MLRQSDHPSLHSPLHSTPDCNCPEQQQPQQLEKTPPPLLGAKCNKKCKFGAPLRVDVHLSGIHSAKEAPASAFSTCLASATFRSTHAVFHLVRGAALILRIPDSSAGMACIHCAMGHMLKPYTMYCRLLKMPHALAQKPRGINVGEYNVPLLFSFLARNYNGEKVNNVSLVAAESRLLRKRRGGMLLRLLGAETETADAYKIKTQR